MAPAAFTEDDSIREFSGIVLDEHHNAVFDAVMMVNPASPRSRKPADSEHTTRTATLKDGTFNLTVNTDHFGKTVNVGIYDAPSNRPIFRGFVAAQKNTTIQIERRPWERYKVSGNVSVLGSYTPAKDLLLIASNRRDLLAKPGCHGRLINIDQSPFLTYYDDDARGITISLTSASGLTYYARTFDTWAELRQALHDHLEAHVNAVTLPMPRLSDGTRPSAARIINANPDSRSHCVVDVQDEILRIQVADGEYWIDGLIEDSGRYGRSKVLIANGNTASPIQWGYEAPGKHSIHINGSNYPQSTIHYNLQEPSDTTVPAGWFTGQASLDETGEAWIAGLLAGSYDIQLMRHGCIVGTTSITAPSGGPIHLDMPALEDISLSLEGSPGIVPENAYDVWIHNQNSDAWTHRKLSILEAPFALQLIGVRKGRHRIVCAGSHSVGISKFPARRSPEDSTAIVHMEPCPPITGQLTTPDGRPAHGVGIHVAHSQWPGISLPPVLTDVNGRFSARSLGTTSRLYVQPTEEWQATQISAHAGGDLAIRLQNSEDR